MNLRFWIYVFKSKILQLKISSTHPVYPSFRQTSLGQQNDFWWQTRSLSFSYFSFFCLIHSMSNSIQFLEYNLANLAFSFEITIIYGKLGMYFTWFFSSTVMKILSDTRLLCQTVTGQPWPCCVDRRSDDGDARGAYHIFSAHGWEVQT